VEREKRIFSEQARESGKPDAIAAKIAEGRLRKFYGEAVLLEQAFVMDAERQVQAVVEEAAQAAGTPIRVAGFSRFALGEGIEKPTADFAAEVASVVGA
jgi:elongation factor Ts